MPTPCFLLEPTDRARISLRVFTFGTYDDPEYASNDRPNHEPCPASVPTGEHGYRVGHESFVTGAGRRHGVDVGEEDAEWNPEHPGTLEVFSNRYEGDPRWPPVCARCGEPFGEDAIRQVNQDLIYLRSDTGEPTTIPSAPDGALWYADWCTIDRWKGPDGRTLVARCPGGGEWMIDSVASNCTLPDDVEHRCWMRHGVPPNITVDKVPEPPFDHTCAAGAGSIQAGDYHGFLTNGAFT